MSKNQAESTSVEKEYKYQTAGVRERTGYVPWWLIGVVVILLAWSVYYLVTFWTPAQGS